jgi:hypothetical protein
LRPIRPERRTVFVKRLFVLDFDSSGGLVTFSYSRGTNNQVISHSPTTID